MLGEAHENKKEQLWILTRQLEFAAYKTSIGGMSGKPNFKGLKKPQDLYKLPSDKKAKDAKMKKVVIPTKEHALKKIYEAHKKT